MPMDRWITKCEKELWRCILEKEIPSFLKQARIHTGFHRFTENGQTCQNKYIFNNNKQLSKLKPRDEIIRRFARLHSWRRELANGQ